MSARSGDIPERWRSQRSSLMARGCALRLECGILASINAKAYGTDRAPCARRRGRFHWRGRCNETRFAGRAERRLDRVFDGFAPGAGRGGSDVFVVRAGDEPVLVAGRGTGRTWNVCPAFSPDGTMLAFATRTSGRLSITVVRMTPSGPSVARRVKLQVPGSGTPPCVRWSADGTRLAYLASGKLVVRGLDGWRRRARVGDPRSEGLSAGRHRRLADRRPCCAAVSRTRKRTADGAWTSVSCGLIVERRDGSDSRVVDRRAGLWVATWSPDGRKILLMDDVDGVHFAMHAVSVDAPFDSVTVVEGVRVNGPRGWPGRNDVSWQPRRS